MSRSLRLLMVEDSEDDEQLLLLELARQGFQVTHTRVWSEASMREAIGGQPWDLIVSDYSMPNFSGLGALAVARESCPDVPFIIISGTIGEETAIEALKSGANDFLIKGRLARLVPAIERELRDREARAEQRRLQAQLMVSDRMASVGTLAAGVAHEINNPLVAVLANLELILRRLDDPGLADADRVRGLREMAIDAREAGERVRQIVRDLKVFSRSDEERRTAIDVRRVIESSLRLAWNEIRHRAQLVKRIEAVPPVAANESRLGQVILNLVVNALQSIPEGDAEHNEILVSVHQRGGDGGMLVIEIADTGSGMPPEVMAKLFTPFFTTKPVGEGTGLGLAICQRIVADIGGHITVDSRVGHGSVFRVHLPIAEPAQAEPEPVAAPVAASPPRRGRILIVDDEMIVATVMRRTLAAEHDATIVTRAEDALERLLAGEQYDVILCDLMMPQMTGMELHAELQRHLPDQADKLVFLTGGAFTPRAREFADRTTNVVLEKPFDPDKLRAVINARVR